MYLIMPTPITQHLPYSARKLIETFGTSHANAKRNVKLYVCICVGPYLQYVLRKITNKTAVSFHGIQGHYVIHNIFCWVLHFASQMLKVSNVSACKPTTFRILSESDKQQVIGAEVKLFPQFSWPLASHEHNADHFLFVCLQDKACMLRVMQDVDKANGYVFGSDSERTLAALASTASGNPGFTDDRIANIREKFTNTDANTAQGDSPDSPMDAMDSLLMQQGDFSLDSDVISSADQSAELEIQEKS